MVGGLRLNGATVELSVSQPAGSTSQPVSQPVKTLLDKQIAWSVLSTCLKGRGRKTPTSELKMRRAGVDSIKFPI